MTTSTEKPVQLKTAKSTKELLVNEFYNLRKAFEAGYSGQLRSNKYEDTREFTISLNFAIFQANQLAFTKSTTSGHLQELETKLAVLKQNYRYLTE